ncbi:hypothetical protein RvY_04372 [Ramazzottius varieornatus]|uniref:Uncharacterized protein n=1 Tax=Ramazzottius varieornatus TaxID=947166 RepID=A0A1D1US57_RAMVA|nr:hypothetical protein RvY_04372 [Ramazzottius varieornatus]
MRRLRVKESVTEFAVISCYRFRDYNPAKRGIQYFDTWLSLGHVMAQLPAQSAAARIRLMENT